VEHRDIKVCDAASPAQNIGKRWWSLQADVARITTLFQDGRSNTSLKEAACFVVGDSFTVSLIVSSGCLKDLPPSTFEIQKLFSPAL
jgi:hypothetical protein